MARSITINREEKKQSFGLARMEDVNYDDIRKRWKENIDEMKIPEDTRTIEEIQAAETFGEVTGFADFFEMEGVEISESVNPLDTMAQMATMLEEGASEEFQAARDERHLNVEEDKALKIEQVEAFVVNEDDPLLEQDFKEKSEKIIQKLVVDTGKKAEAKSGFEKKTEDKSYFTSSSSSSFTKPQSTTSSYRPTTASSTATTENAKTTVHNNEERQKEIHYMFSSGADRMRDFVANGSVIHEEKQTVPVNRFGGKKRFGIKSLLNQFSHWKKSKKAKLLWKVGAAVVLETALAMITKQRQFDGPGQLMGYIGMMLGVFYVGASLRAEGFDMRRLALI